MNLDSRSIYATLDKFGVGSAIEQFPDQMRQVLADVALVKVPRDYAKATAIVVAGMGGSNLGAHFLRSAFTDRLSIPLLISAGYTLPGFTGKNTIVLLSSYSGTTEETLFAAKDAKKRGAKRLVICENNPKSPLYKLMMKENIPGYIFEAKHNPSGQPRLGLGYSIMGISALIARAGFLSLSVKEFERLIGRLEVWTRELRPTEPAAVNGAKRLALSLQGRLPVFIGAEHLAGNLHIIRNQLNETAKQICTYLELPDLNHHALEGLGFPAAHKKLTMFVGFSSSLYLPRNQKRLALTMQVAKQQGVASVVHELKSADKLTQAFELLQFGVWLSYYLGILNKVDPVLIPYVDWFKAQLK